MSAVGGKYRVGGECRWCGASPAEEYVLYKVGTKHKRYTVSEMACRECAARLELKR